MIYAERAEKGFFKAVMASVKLALVGAVFFCASKFQWLRRKLPMPGEGPSEDEMHGGSFRIKCWSLPHEPEEGQASISNSSEPVRVFSSMAVRFLSLLFTFSHHCSPCSHCVLLKKLYCMSYNKLGCAFSVLFGLADTEDSSKASSKDSARTLVNRVAGETQYPACECLPSSLDAQYNRISSCCLPLISLDVRGGLGGGACCVGKLWGFRA